MSDNLAMAAEKGNIAKMQQLLAGGADVNMKVRRARCPLSSLPVPPPWHASRRRLAPCEDVATSEMTFACRK
eukprot:3242262-Prymnesium_polylepis.2